MNELRIGNRVLGPGRRTMVVAELGVNHDGSQPVAGQVGTHLVVCEASQPRT